MQVTETLSQGLKREYDILLPASDLAEKLNGQLADLKTKVRIKGFRPGKVPVEHLRRVYGKSVMAEVVEKAIADANRKIVDENQLRLAREPKVELPGDKSAIEAALEARGDLQFKVALEVLPVFEIGDFSQIELERLVADIADSEVEDAADRIAEMRRAYTDKPEGAKAEIRDRVTVDFDVTVKAVAMREPLPIDDEFAKSLGFESLDNLKQRLRDQIAAEYARASRDKLKRQLLDKLDSLYSFELPEGLVNQEFDSIWSQVMREQQASGRSFADENTTEESARADYGRIAERRVRLGLLLAEVGNRANVKVSDEEMTQALVARAGAFPGQEKQVWDFYRNNQQALAELRAPIYEEKVVDHIIGLAGVTERKTTTEELLKPIDDDMPAAAQETELPAAPLPGASGDS